MKFNISDPSTGGQTTIEIDNEKYIRPFFDRRMGSEIDGAVMGDDYKGYVFKITGGNDKQGFAMKQGIMVNGRVRILFKKRATLYRPRRVGMRRRRSVRGCIVGPDLAVLFLRVIKKGDKDIDKVTNADRPNRLGRKRASRIRAAFNLDKKLDDVRQYVVHRKIEKKIKVGEEEKERVYYKAPKIQRLITEKRVRRKKAIKNERVNRWKTTKEQKQKYEKLISQFVKEKKAAQAAERKAAEEAKAAAAKK